MTDTSSTHRLYLDESGDHTSTNSDDIGKRYLGLVGVVCKIAESEALRQAVEGFKHRHLPYDPDDPPLLHRDDIVRKAGVYACLYDPARQQAFDDGLLKVLESTPFRVIAVVIDKVEHGRKKYRRLQHPYHYALVAMLERYCGWLKRTCTRGDVLAESRGAVEDSALKSAFRSFYASGSFYIPVAQVQSTLSSKEIKIKKKAQNIAGLQLADVLAHPLTRDVLYSYERIKDRGGAFADRVAEVVEPKYNRQIYQNRIRGYGRVILA